MDIQKENTKYLASLLANCGATQDEINDLSFDDKVGFFESNRLADWFVSQINFGWRVWQAAKASVPEGFVLVEKKNTEDWYLDEFEGMWFDRDGIDGGLCELDIGEVQAVEHKEYLITESNTLYATKVWNDQRQSIDTWEFFKTKEEANKAAAYCKAKFNEDEVQELSND